MPVREAVVVLITAPPALAPMLARSLVEARLAACVAITPIRSIYRWEGAIQDDEEQQLVLKTSRDRVDAIQAHVREHHTYEVPEVLVLPVLEGSPAYLKWIGDQT